MVTEKTQDEASTLWASMKTKMIQLFEQNNEELHGDYSIEEAYGRLLSR